LKQEFFGAVEIAVRLISQAQVDGCIAVVWIHPQRGLQKFLCRGLIHTRKFDVTPPTVWLNPDGSSNRFHGALQKHSVRTINLPGFPNRDQACAEHKRSHHDSEE